ncbi:MAG: DUF3558 domain-containing protein [Pseudonocardiaceae bacterium]
MGLVVLLVGVGVGGCAGGDRQDGAIDAEPVPAATDGPIPPVRNPKNLAEISPCLLLTPAQLEANRIDQPGRPRNVLGSAGCEWSDQARTREVRTFVDLGNDVLRNVYAKRETFPLMELTQVAGYPAIRTKDNVKGSTCYFRVAAAERQTLVLGFTSLGQGGDEPCKSARALAEIVINNLPPLKV